MDGLVSSALMIRLSLQPSPASDASAFNNIRALRSRWAGLFPFRISASSRSRSSPLSRTIYFFTEISFAAMIASVARVATKANHQILSIWLKRPTRLTPMTVSMARNQFLDLAQLLLAEKHLLADEEGGRAERAAVDGCLRVLDQLRLDLGLLRARKQFCRIEAARRKSLESHFGIVHFPGLAPHVVKRRVDVSLEHALELRGDGGAHQVERVDRKERIPCVGLDLKALHEALGLQRVKFALVPDAGERFGGGLVVGGLED